MSLCLVTAANRWEPQGTSVGGDGMEWRWVTGGRGGGVREVEVVDDVMSSFVDDVVVSFLGFLWSHPVAGSDDDAAAEEENDDFSLPVSFPFHCFGFLCNHPVLGSFLSSVAGGDGDAAASLSSVVPLIPNDANVKIRPLLLLLGERKLFSCRC